MQTRDYPDLPPDFGHWLAGFIDGEGTFAIRVQNGHLGFPSYATSCIVKLRDDDRAILEEVHRRTGIGRVHMKRAGGSGRNSRAQAAWQVQSRGDCGHLVELLDDFPLRAKKARDYAIWRKAVLIGLQVRNGGNWALEHNELLWERLGELRIELAKVRGYPIPTH